MPSKPNNAYTMKNARQAGSITKTKLVGFGGAMLLFLSGLHHVMDSEQAAQPKSPAKTPAAVKEGRSSSAMLNSGPEIKAREPQALQVNLSAMFTQKCEMRQISKAQITYRVTVCPEKRGM